MSEHNSPNTDDNDVFADVVDQFRSSTLVFGHLDLGAPWGLEFEAAAHQHAQLYVVGQGTARLELENKEVVTLNRGDVALVFAAGTHSLRDREHSPVVSLNKHTCWQSNAANPIRLGRDGSRTSLVVGAFDFGRDRKTPLLDELPSVVHIAGDDPDVPESFAAAVRSVLDECATHRPGSSVILSRLFDVLFVHSLRMAIERRALPGQNLRAISDPTIGRALKRIHQRPATRWTLHALARDVGLSRSAFAAHFRALVGVAPLAYLTRWRMQRASELLRESDLPMIEVAERVGYGSEAAFTRAFKRHEGVGPAGYRRTRRTRRSA